MSADLSRYRGRPPPPSWKPPPLPGEGDHFDLRRSYHSSDDEVLTKTSDFSSSGNTPVNVSRTEEHAKPKVTVSAQESAKKLERSSNEAKTLKPKEVTKPIVIEKQKDKNVPATPIAKPATAAQTAPTLPTTSITEPLKRTWVKPSAEANPPKSEAPKKTEPKTTPKEDPKPTIFKNRESPSSKTQDSTSFTKLVSTGLKAEDATSFVKPTSTGLKSEDTTSFFRPVSTGLNTQDLASLPKTVSTGFKPPDPIQSPVKKSETVQDTENQLDDKPKGNLSFRVEQKIFTCVLVQDGVPLNWRIFVFNSSKS